MVRLATDFASVLGVCYLSRDREGLLNSAPSLSTGIGPATEVATTARIARMEKFENNILMVGDVVDNEDGNRRG